MKNSDFNTVKRFAGEFVKQRFGTILLAALFMIIYAASNSAQPLLVETIFKEMFNTQESEYKYIIPFAIVGLFSVMGASSYLANVFIGKAGFGVVRDMYKRLFRHFIEFDMEMHHKMPSGEMVSRMINDISNVRTAMQSAVIVVFKQSLTFIGLVGVMFYQNWELSLVAVGILIFTVYPIKRVAKRLRKLAKLSQIQAADLLTKLTESFKGVRQIKAFQRENFEIDRTNELIDATINNKIKSLKVSSALAPITSIIGGLAVAIVLTYASSKIASGETNTGEVASFVAALFMAGRPLKAMGGLSNVLQSAIVSCERFYQMIDTQSRITDKPEAEALQLVKGEITLENITFSYDGQRDALKDFNMVIPAGKKVAIVGSSGSGKSTIVNMLLRFFEPQSGRVLIDGQEIRDITIESLRRNISLVTQDVFLFDDTIKSNIAYGRPGEVSDDEILSAAKTAAADEFIMKLPEGYQTKVGEDGLKLSGGQKQRISIARVVLRNSPIVIFDEATSSLDYNSEREIQAALDKMVVGKTAIIIAHRLSTIINSDLIYVLDNGRVVASGTHDELLNNSEEYKRIFNQ